MNINDIKVTPLKQIFDYRGKVMHMMRNDDVYFQKFGEIYFSTVHPGIVKGWHFHERMDLSYACIYGKIKLVVTDGKEFREFYLSPENYQLIQIPHGLWNGFKGIGSDEAIIANCASIPHDPNEIHTMSQDNFKYIW